MPRFHFDVVEDGQTLPDDEGLDLLSVDVARLEAARAAAEMLRDRARERVESGDVSIVVRDGSGELFTVTVALKVLERV